MRDNGDARSSAEVKLDLLKDLKVDLVFDDDSSVIEALLKEGYVAVQVHGYRYNESDLVPPVGEECLGKSCRWFAGRADSLCFRVGVLPHCGPELKAAKKWQSRVLEA